jgi:hypothetical protein
MAGELTNHIARFICEGANSEYKHNFENKLQAFITKKKAPKT